MYKRYVNTQIISSKRRNAYWVFAALLSFGPLVSPAFAQSLRANIMTVGEYMAAPVAYLELCERSPIDCVRGKGFNLELIRSDARNTRTDIIRTALVPQNRPAPPQYQVASTDPTLTRLSYTPRQEAAAPAGTAFYYNPRPGSVTEAYPYRRLNWAGRDEAQVNNAPVINEAVISEAVLSPTRLVPAAERMTLQTEPATVQAPYSVSYFYRAVPAYHQPRLSLSVPQYTPPALPALRPEPAFAWQSQSSVSSLSEPKETPQDYERIALTRDTRKLISTINYTVNRTLIPAKDEKIYGVADYWTAPGLNRGTRADCEDYALQKRRELMWRGVPAGALTMAIVRTRKGEEHAVLIVSTQQGDYVLDNLNPNVRLWHDTGYEWIMRQAPGSGLEWVSLKDAPPAPRSRQKREEPALTPLAPMLQIADVR